MDSCFLTNYRPSAAQCGVRFPSYHYSQLEGVYFRMSMSAFSTILFALHVIALIGVVTFLLVLLSRFVRAHQRIAIALSEIAEKLTVHRP